MPRRRRRGRMSESRSCRDGVVPTQAILVPTEDTTRFSYLMRTLITVDKPVFVTGMTGTGKTVMVQNLLRSLEPYPDEGVYPRLAISAPRPCFRPKLGHDVPLMQSTELSEQHLTHTPRAPD